MVKTSRIVTTTLIGLVFGIIFMVLERYVGIPDPFWPVGTATLLFLTLMGVVIGASSLRMNWAAHGSFWGALFGVFFAVSVVGVVPYPSLNFVGSLIVGFLIETLATKVFKQPQ